ncbi:MAG: 6-carboxytetrahydropterin synthase [Deltaproteobacteria bacterium TMED126]|jgi:6-pyruvoyltetrahydropterin/6-carboxytetrahydropterin synthase|nr:6-carboxytetrahydropterin synthase [Candidatus Dadabacteria bacterium]NSW97792.1 6-carboxytetrahydropterin synthase [Deltaproteobacteria bacterium TMED126]|tara:strand:- start:4135 stop:4551 length:417 start_codon:yes stop_codon:yes gene_type:complete
MAEFTTLSKRIEFSASHRYWNNDFTEEENLSIFGKCTSEYGHGHNYVLETTVRGPVDEDTGMIINIYKLKPILKSVLKEFDHKFLNLDTDYFEKLIPTTENFAKILYECINEKLKDSECELLKVRLYETKDLYVDYWK